VFSRLSLNHIILAPAISMADIQVLKPDRDYSKEVDEQLPQAEELAKVLQRARYLLIT
jgi:hypothetical protein